LYCPTIQHKLLGLIGDGVVPVLQVVAKADGIIPTQERVLTQILTIHHPSVHAGTINQTENRPR
jgi:hypothetical protein